MTPTRSEWAVKTVGDAMTVDVLCVPEFMSMSNAATLFCERDISSAPVINDAGECVGILSATDFVKQRADCYAEHYLSVQEGPLSVESRPDMVRYNMSSAVQAVTSATPLPRAARMMASERVRHLPVVDDGELVGFVSANDVLRAIVDDDS